MSKPGVGNRAAQAVERMARILRAREHATGLNPAQWEALRYLARCNRFSNSPLALSRYLSATKGTTSQTLIALEQKGFIEKSPRPGERRSLVLSLTPAGKAQLDCDPWLEIAGWIDGRPAKAKKRTVRTAGRMLEFLVSRHGLPTFGACADCRYFRQRGAPSGSKAKHWCLLYEAALTGSESRRICAGHQPE